MRFAYIDSQGVEVPIPSVDALALRIRLGAIGPDTQLYDAQADRWGPASSHDIFHTLSRDTTEEEGFVAPPPPVMPEEAEEPTESEQPAAEAPPAAGGAEAGPGGTATPRPKGARPVFDLSDEFPDQAGGEETGAAADEAGEGGAGEHAPVEPGPQPPEEEDLGLELTLTDIGLPAGDEPAGDEPAGDEAAGDEAAAPSSEGPEAPPEEGAFDFGGFGAGELEGAPAEEGEAPPGEATPRPASGDEAPLTPFEEMTGAGAEEEMDFSAPADLSGGLELEPPMSEFTSDSPPGWMQGEGKETKKEPERRRQGGGGGAGADEGVMQFGSGKAEPPEETDRKSGTQTPRAYWDREDRPRPTPRNRPSPPRWGKKRSPLQRVAWVVIVVALGGGGWYGWHWHQARLAAQRAAAAAAARPPVTLPQIPAALLPKMRRFGDAALAATLGRLGRMEAGFGLPAEPDTSWLAGIYMANASRYGAVPRYWRRIREFVDTVRAVDAQIFHQEYLGQLARAGIKGDTARMLLARADSGFAATREDRWAAYARMDDLANASLDLHQFLVDNEAQIEYEPAAGGVSRDPVLEAVPTTKALGKAMWSRVDQITAALDSLGTLDKVTTKQLMSVLFAQVRKAGFK